MEWRWGIELKLKLGELTGADLYSCILLIGCAAVIWGGILWLCVKLLLEIF
jgi:hypothetical protein